MSFTKGKSDGGISDGIIQMKSRVQSEIFQEILIRNDGSVEIPWITPQASNLVMDLWKHFNKEEPFPVTVLSGHIYCG
jgi:hypothetical protein